MFNHLLWYVKLLYSSFVISEHIPLNMPLYASVVFYYYYYLKSFFFFQASLRHLDMSLFCQLLSLNEAIQEFKISMQDRYSEYTGSEYTGSEYNGSEYSYGGMGSRTGSFSSLIEESDWNTDFRMNYDDPNSPSSAAEGINDMGEITASASSLMQQIEALALRAEADFSL